MNVDVDELSPPAPPTPPTTTAVPLTSPTTRSAPQPAPPSPLPRRAPPLGGGRPRCAEVAGGTTAECAAVFCCVPCGLMDLLVLAAVRVPAGLCRRAIRERSRRKRVIAKKKVAMKRGVLFSPKIGGNGGGGDDDFLVLRALSLRDAAVWPEKSPAEEMAAMEEEVWGQFHGRGFWRSPSREDEEE